MSVITYELHMQYIHDVRFKHSCFLIIYRTSSAIFLENLIEYDEKTVAVCYDFILIDLKQSIYQFCMLLI